MTVLQGSLLECTAQASGLMLGAPAYATRKCGMWYFLYP